MRRAWCVISCAGLRVGRRLIVSLSPIDTGKFSVAPLPLDAVTRTPRSSASPSEQPSPRAAALLHLPITLLPSCLTPSCRASVSPKPSLRRLPPPCAPITSPQLSINPSPPLAAPPHGAARLRSPHPWPRVKARVRLEVKRLELQL